MSKKKKKTDNVESSRYEYPKNILRAKMQLALSTRENAGLENVSLLHNLILTRHSILKLSAFFAKRENVCCRRRGGSGVHGKNAIELVYTFGKT